MTAHRSIFRHAVALSLHTLFWHTVFTRTGTSVPLGVAECFPSHDGVGWAFVSTQADNIYVHEMWGLSLMTAETLAWEKTELQRNKNRVRVDLGNCQITSRNMFKKILPFFSDTQNFRSPLITFAIAPSFPERAAWGGGDSCESARPQQGEALVLLINGQLAWTQWIWDACCLPGAFSAVKAMCTAACTWALGGMGQVHPYFFF